MYLRHLLLIIPYVIGFIMVTVKDKIWGFRGFYRIKNKILSNVKLHNIKNIFCITYTNKF